MNKDRLGGVRRRLLFPILEGHAKAREFAAIVPLSALRSDGVRALVAEVKKLLPEGPALFADDSISDKPLRFFVAEFVREQILRKTREEVPHGVAVVVERFDESGRMPKIDLAIHVDKDSHKAIVIGAGGSLLKAIGTDARAQVERLMGQQVALRTFVRVTPGWYEKESTLRDMRSMPPEKSWDGDPATEDSVRRREVRTERREIHERGERGEPDDPPEKRRPIRPKRSHDEALQTARVFSAPARSRREADRRGRGAPQRGKVHSLPTLRLCAAEGRHRAR